MVVRCVALVAVAGLLGVACAGGDNSAESGLDVSAVPESTASPTTANMVPGSTAPSTAETTVTPETSVAVETTIAPETSVAVETTVAPETTVAVDTTLAPATTTAPVTTTPDGFSLADWPDDFDEYWPDPADVLQPLAADWVAPAGWVEHDPQQGDPLGGGWGSWGDLVRSELPNRGFDDRLLAFDFNTIYEWDYYGRFISPPMTGVTSLGDLPDGAYHALLVGWDPATPDRATFRIGPVMDCTPDGVWGVGHPVYDDPICGYVPGERHAAEPVGCSAQSDVCVDLEVPLDDAFTVLLYGFSTELSEEGWPKLANTLGQGPDFAELLSTFYDDYDSYLLSNESLGPERIEAEIIPGSPFGNIDDEIRFNYSQVLRWQRDGLPLLTMYKRHSWTDDPKAVTPWGNDHRPDPNGADVCDRWRVELDGYSVDGDGWTVPCTITQNFLDFSRVIRYWGSFMKIDGRVAWTASLPRPSS